jgi:hypothetical protein
VEANGGIIVLELMGARVREVDDLGTPGIWLAERRMLLLNRDIDPKSRGEVIEQALSRMTTAPSA